jgi:hypothetical protein
MKLKLIHGLVVGIWLMSFMKAQAQYPNVMISNEFLPNETSIFINPKNTRHLIAGANLNSYYHSLDGGYNWTRNPMNSTLGVWGDPCLIIDTAQNLYFFHLSNPQNGNWIDRIVCQKMSKGSLSWNNGAGIGLNGSKQQDKEWACVNPRTNEIYVTWTQFDKYGSNDTAHKSNIMFSKSADEGITWTNALQINKVSGDCEDGDNTVEGAVPACGPNGEIYVAWAGPEGLVFDKSVDGGVTWLDNDIHVSNIPGGWDYSVPGIYRANGLPVTCCDVSNGPHRGTIYINWSDERNSIPGNQDIDIWLAKSTDGGNTWSQPLKVNNDTDGKLQFFSWMAVDQVTGYVWFVFYDRRNYADNQTDVFLAVSKDGGETFENFKVSESPFTPISNIFFGDYTGISAYNNVVRPIWTRLHAEELSVWTAITDNYFTAFQPEEMAPIAIDQSYPNPFSESTLFSFKIRRASKINLSVNDVFGKKVAILVNNVDYQPGKYSIRFDPETYKLPSGVYYFKLEGNGINKSRKIVYKR